MPDNAPSIRSLVLIPALVTLAVTILRLVGELQNWNDLLFSNVAPGGEAKPGFVGIAWLMPIFGFWFGYRLRRATGQPAHAGKAARRFALGAVILIGGLFGLIALGLVVMPTAKEPGEPSGLPYSLALAGLATIVMFPAWTRLGLTLIVYGVLARLPVVVVTWLALQNDWNSHYVKLPAGTVLPTDMDPFVFLALPQLTFWIVTTLMIGGLFGCLGAAIARRGNDRPA